MLSLVHDAVWLECVAQRWTSHPWEIKDISCSWSAALERVLDNIRKAAHWALEVHFVSSTGLSSGAYSGRIHWGFFCYLLHVLFFFNISCKAQPWAVGQFEGPYGVWIVTTKQTLTEIFHSFSHPSLTKKNPIYIQASELLWASSFSPGCFF